MRFEYLLRSYYPNMTTLQPKLMCGGCDIKLKKSVGRKKLVSDEVEVNVFSHCLKRGIGVDDILCNEFWLSIYKNNSDEDYI